MKTFTTSLSSTARWGGSLVLVIFALVFVMFIERIRNGEGGHLSAYIPMPLLTVALLLCVVWSTRGYEVGDGELVVRRVLGSKRFDLRGASVQRDGDVFGGLVRMVGNSGFFSFDGMYYSPRLGRVRVHARNKEHGVVLVLASGRKVVLSPDDADGFVAAVQAAR